MRYNYFMFFLLLICSSCSSHLSLDNPSFVKKIRKATYQKDYQRIKQLCEETQLIDNKKHDLRLLSRIVTLSESLDTMIFPPLDPDWIPFRNLRVDEYQTISKDDGTYESRLVKEGGLTEWRRPTHIMRGFRLLKTEQIRTIQKILKKKKWFGGKIDGKWSNELLLALRFYQIFIAKKIYQSKYTQSENLFSITNPPHRLDINSMDHFGLIDITKTGEYRSTRIIQFVQTALKHKGYFEGEANNKMDEKTKKALKQFQKDNGLIIGHLDFETLKALNINF